MGNKKVNLGQEVNYLAANTFDFIVWTFERSVGDIKYKQKYINILFHGLEQQQSGVVWWILCEREMIT